MVPAGEPLFLYSQRHHHVRTLQGCVQIVINHNSGRESGRNLGHEVARATEDDLGPEARQQLRVGARHPAVVHVAHDHHAKPAKLFLVVQNGERIQQPWDGC